MDKKAKCGGDSAVKCIAKAFHELPNSKHLVESKIQRQEENTYAKCFVRQRNHGLTQAMKGG
jgi:hypothetical protein